MSDLAETLAARFRPIGLDELNEATALQRRSENKYLVDEQVLEQLVLELVPTHRALEIDARRLFAYRTVYYDSDDLASYRSHIQRRRRRFKCRTRHYLDTGRTTVEVKLKGARGLTIKRQLDQQEPGVDRLSPDAELFVRQAIQDEYGQPPPANLHPILATGYERLTLAAPLERITCDFALRFTAIEGATFAIAPGTVIVETKSVRGRTTADRILLSLGARPVRVSKYVIGVALAHPDSNNNDFRRLLSRHFDWHTETRLGSRIGPALSE